MAGLDYLLKEYKTACGNTVNVGDVVMNKNGCHFYIVVGIGLNNKSSEPDRWNGRVLLKHYSDKDDNTPKRYYNETDSLERYYLVKDGVLILKPK